ncbi:unnamed protein product [Caretta caretta]
MYSCPRQRYHERSLCNQKLFASPFTFQHVTSTRIRSELPPSSRAGRQPRDAPKAARTFRTSPARRPADNGGNPAGLQRPPGAHCSQQIATLCYTASSLFPCSFPMSRV